MTNRKRHRRFSWATPLIMGGLCLLTLTGCVRRRLTVRSNPPGATVFVDTHRIGMAPCSVDFTYYGTREIRLVKSGFETLTVNQPIPTPVYQRPVLDFVTENLLPIKIRDNRVASFNLQPQRIEPTDNIIGRGEQLRTQATTAAVLGVPPIGPVPVVSPTPGPPVGFAPPPPPPPPPPVGAPGFTAPGF